MFKQLLLPVLIFALHTPQMPETVREYMTPKVTPVRSETVEEYMERGRKWATYLESLKQVNDYIYIEYDEPEEVVTEQAVVETTEAATTSDGMIFYSNMELTAYMWTGNPCADGVYPSEGFTVACNDPNLWHRWIFIEGVGTFYVHDTGGMSSNVIDIYMGTYDACVNFGRQSANVYILE